MMLSMAVVGDADPALRPKIPGGRSPGAAKPACGEHGMG